MIYSCCKEKRKAAVSNPAVNLNGIDYLEVLDSAAVQIGLPRQQTLVIHCLKTAPTTLKPKNILITGGESIAGITAAWVAVAATPPGSLPQLAQTYFQSLPDAAKVLLIGTNKPGDFSPYTLRFVKDSSTAPEDPFELTEVPDEFDLQLAEVQFSFKVECAPNFDCKPQSPYCLPVPVIPPPINYLAKDYGSFRGIMLDRLRQLLPNWNPSNEADLGVALAELIAYVGDYLSYRQDAIATEAYLKTARSRISLRRHALLVDYHLHDGCNARVWIQLQVSGSPGEQVFLDRTLTRFYTYAPGMPASLAGADKERTALLAGGKFFEPMQDAVLYHEHNQMLFYTWGDTSCCLPAGATEATLYGYYPNLQPGTVLIFQEVKGPATGESADADVRHRCAVMLTQVATQTATGSSLVDSLFPDANGNPIRVTEIQWSQEDALPFPLCISSSDSNGEPINDVSVAFGNVVLADHGLSFAGIGLGTVPAPRLFFAPTPAADRCQIAARTPVPVRFAPQVADSPLTQALPLPPVSPIASASVSLSAAGPVSVKNTTGSTYLTVATTNASSWPQLFGIVVMANSGNRANFDLSVLYNPPGGPAGVPGPVIVERFLNLSLNAADPNYVVTKINSASQLIRVPGTYVPPTTPPAGFPSAPTMLVNTGTVNLQDLSSPPVTYLTLEATVPSGWPALFAVTAQLQPLSNLLSLQVIYDPAYGTPGVALPATLEEFANLSSSAAANEVNANSNLIAVKSLFPAAISSVSANALTNFDPSEAVPVISLVGTVGNTTTTWTSKPDLLESGESDPVFVVEVESDGTATLRFGDDVNGKTPDQGTSFVADYRIGNGTAGNVGADSIVLLSAADTRIQSCRNPLPATGGTDPETNDQIRCRAPQAFLTQERAITMQDYESIAEMNPQVDRAVASLRWTGSWHTVFVAVEPAGAGNLTPALQQTLMASEERYRLAGQDLLLDSPQYVSLEIVLQVCVDPNYFQADVQQALLQVLGSGILPDGTKGLFYPDNFTFGQTVYLSRVYAAARKVAGVTTVIATTFQPQGVSTAQHLASGEIKLGSLQIARLANDASFPDHGQLTLIMQGGK